MRSVAGQKLSVSPVRPTPTTRSKCQHEKQISSQIVEYVCVGERFVRVCEDMQWRTCFSRSFNYTNCQWATFWIVNASVLPKSFWDIWASLTWLLLLLFEFLLLCRHCDSNIFAACVKQKLQKLCKQALNPLLFWQFHYFRSANKLKLRNVFNTHTHTHAHAHTQLRARHATLRIRNLVVCLLIVEVATQLAQQCIKIDGTQLFEREFETFNRKKNNNIFYIGRERSALKNNKAILLKLQIEKKNLKS